MRQDDELGDAGAHAEERLTSSIRYNRRFRINQWQEVIAASVI